MFHGFIYLTLRIFKFSVTILLMYVAFWDLDELHRRMDALLPGPGLHWPGSVQNEAAHIL